MLNFHLLLSRIAERLAFENGYIPVLYEIIEKVLEKIIFFY